MLPLSGRDNGKDRILIENFRKIVQIRGDLPYCRQNPVVAFGIRSVTFEHIWSYLVAVVEVAEIFQIC